MKSRTNIWRKSPCLQSEPVDWSYRFAPLLPELDEPVGNRGCILSEAECLPKSVSAGLGCRPAAHEPDRTYEADELIEPAVLSNLRPQRATDRGSLQRRLDIRRRDAPSRNPFKRKR